MNPLGHSGALITVLDNQVLKKGVGTQDQARYCQELGRSVCPDIISIVKNNYSMERLEPCSIYPIHLSKEIFNLLKNRVWCRNIDVFSPWRFKLYEWAVDFEWLIDHAEYIDMKLYPSKYPINYCRIHGDPTFANSMRRSGELILIDPIRPTGKIPSLREVDIAKIVQSLLGWEYQLDNTYPIKEPQMLSITNLLTPLSKLEVKRIWFWTSIHCARLIPYSKHDHIIKWSERMSKACYEISLCV